MSEGDKQDPSDPPTAELAILLRERLSNLPWYTRHVVIIVAVSTLLGLLLLLLPTELAMLRRIAVLAWLTAVAMQAMRMYQKMHPRSRPRAYDHGSVASRLTLESGVLERAEEVIYDERPHWGHSLEQLFNLSSLAATGAILFCLLSEWSSIGVALFKLLVLVAASYWLARQELDYIWTRYVITDTNTRIISRPPAIFGAENDWSLILVKIETKRVKRPIYMRLLRLNAGHMVVDAPGAQDKRFNNLRWVKDPRRFRQLLTPDA